MIWTYKNKQFTSIEDFPEGCFGFIYCITNITNGKKYIGKKVLSFKRKKNFGKKQIESLQDKRLKKYEVVIKESDWNDYTGSCIELNEDIKKGHQIKREIIEFAFNSRELTYLEVKLLFKYNVLETSDYYNRNILSKFFKKKELL